MALPGWVVPPQALRHAAIQAPRDGALTPAQAQLLLKALPQVPSVPAEHAGATFCLFWCVVQDQQAGAWHVALPLLDELAQARAALAVLRNRQAAAADDGEDGAPQRTPTTGPDPLFTMASPAVPRVDYLGLKRLDERVRARIEAKLRLLQVRQADVAMDRQTCLGSVRVTRGIGRPHRQAKGRRVGPPLCTRRRCAAANGWPPRCSTSAACSRSPPSGARAGAHPPSSPIPP